MEYTNLGKSGLKVSKVILGAMSYGDPKWQGWVLSEEESLPLLEYAYKVGIRTWDTANVYSNGRSEEIIGKAIKKFSIPRERLVILSKCYFGVDPDDLTFPIAKASVNDGDMLNQQGLSRKNIINAVDQSVARLGTYIDVLQIHRLDRDTPKEEIMRALNDVVESGKVRYIGASSMAAWEFQMLQNIAEKNGWHKFISMQNYYNLIYREEENEMIPYCKYTGVGLIPWSPIARGVLARPYDSRESEREKSDNYLKSTVRGSMLSSVPVPHITHEFSLQSQCVFISLSLFADKIHRRSFFRPPHRRAPRTSRQETQQVYGPSGDGVVYPQGYDADRGAKQDRAYGRGP